MNLLEKDPRSRLSLSYGALPALQKVTELSAQLPSNPQLALSALRNKRKVFQEMNQSLHEELQKSLHLSSLQWATDMKRTSSLRKHRKRIVKQPRSVFAFSTPSTPRSDLKVYWREISGDIGPGARSGGSLSVVGDEAVVLYGGEAHMTLGDFWAFSVGSHKWSQRHFDQKALEPRAGHTAIFYDKRLLVIGGESTDSHIQRYRELHSSMLFIDPITRTWAELQTVNCGIGMRKYHCAVEGWKHILIHGGFGERGEMLDSPAELSMASLRWRRIRTEGSGPGQRAYHTAVSVKLKRDSLASGIYFFGGMDETRTATNELHLLKAGPHGCIWSLIHTTGTAPAPRFQHSMTYFPELSLIVVFGGRQDERSNSGYRCFGELHLLQLDTMTWSTAVLYGRVPENRCGHAAAALGSRLVLFGGLHNSHFCGGSTFVGELDQAKARHWIDEDQRHRELAEKVALFKQRSKIQRATRFTRKHLSADPSPGRSTPQSNLFTLITLKVHDTAVLKGKITKIPLDLCRL